MKATLPFSVLLLFLLFIGGEIFAAEIAGTSIVPHRIEPAMRYRRPRDMDLAARVQIFVKGPATPARWDGRTPAELLAANEWAWHDLADAVAVPEGALAVWSFNGKPSRWGVGKSFALEAEGLARVTQPIVAPAQWISAATFLASDGAVQPDTIVLHIANEAKQALQVTSLRLWLPKAGAATRVLWPQEPLTVAAMVPPGDKGFVRIRVPRLPLTYASLELSTSAGSLWAHLRIKREVFDISGGWVNDNLTREPYLQLLRHLHVNAGQIDHVPGYTDQPALYDRYPLKLFNRLWPLETIGDMCRSLRELSCPVPCAYWSQGPGDGWKGGWFGSGRARRSPTPDELRAQAMHALSTRITSLYWFNLSLKSLLLFPDTWEPITRIGREIRMLEPLLLEGDAYRFERRTRDGAPDWDLASIAAPDAAVLFASDLAYTADEKENIFKFGSPRAVEFTFALPPWLRVPKDVFRVDADGIHETKWRSTGQGVVIEDQRSRDAIYIATQSPTVRAALEQRRQSALAVEAAHPIEREALELLKK